MKNEQLQTPSHLIPSTRQNHANQRAEKAVSLFQSSSERLTRLRDENGDAQVIVLQGTSSGHFSVKVHRGSKE